MSGGVSYTEKIFDSHLCKSLPDGRFVLDTDASNVSVEDLLFQLQNSHDRVVEYLSIVPPKAEQSYCITRRKLLVVVKSIVHFYKHLYGK